jgi:hypothetical protein
MLLTLISGFNEGKLRPLILYTAKLDFKMFAYCILRLHNRRGPIRPQRTRGVAAIDSTIDSSIVSNLTTTIDFFNSKGTISIVDAIKHVEKTNVMTKIIFKI